MAQPARDNLKGSVRLGGYLKKLRSGYGYSLRRVEERARSAGGEIDNSQLSRYEKGICYPSFDKLRVLASVFNVSIQSFSDVVDLEVFDELKPATGEPKMLLKQGQTAVHEGNNGLGFALFERAIERLHDETPGPERNLLLARARINQASALTRLGKLALAEQQLRTALRGASEFDRTLRAQAVLLLANIHADLGDVFLSEIEAERALELARSVEDQRKCAMALHTLGRVVESQGRHADAIASYREAGDYYEQCDEKYEAVRVRVNVGQCYVALNKFREGIRLLRACIQDARSGGFRRLEAQSWGNLGEAYYCQQDLRRARGCFRESDSIASFNNEKQSDLLFFNAYYEWKMASEESNPTREKIAFGRMKALRSSVERRLPEAEAFDLYVEGGRSDA